MSFGVACAAAKDGYSVTDGRVVLVYEKGTFYYKFTGDMEAASNDGVTLVPATFTSRQINYENWKIERSDE